MNKEIRLGEKLVDGMNHIEFSRWRDIVWSAFKAYKKEIWNDATEETDPWFQFLDIVASKFGYYGDLDLHIEKMEVRLHQTLSKMKDKGDVNKFVMDCANHVEEQERLGNELTEHYGFNVMET